MTRAIAAAACLIALQWPQLLGPAANITLSVAPIGAV